MKYNLSNIMKEAWNLYHNCRMGGWCACTYPSFAECLKNAWRAAKHRIHQAKLEADALEEYSSIMRKRVSIARDDLDALFDLESEIDKELRRLSYDLNSKRGTMSKPEFVECQDCTIAKKNVLKAIRNTIRNQDPMWVTKLGPIPTGEY